MMDEKRWRLAPVYLQDINRNKELRAGKVFQRFMQSSVGKIATVMLGLTVFSFNPIMCDELHWEPDKSLR